MSDTMLICKTIIGVAMSAAIGFATYKTENANCLWAMLIVLGI